MKTRNVALDYAKGISIIVVVFVHLWRGLFGSGLLTDISEKTILAISSTSTLICIPAFFMVSGLLYGGSIKNRHGIAELAGKFDSIFYPYIIWSLIIGVFEVLGNGVRNGSTAPSDLLYLLWNPKGIFWFLYVLFMAFICIEVLIKVVGVKLAPLFLLIAAIGLLFVYPQAPVLFCLREFCMSLIYFAMGVFVTGRYPKSQIGSWVFLALGIFALAALEYISHMVMGVRSGSIRSVTPDVFWLGASTLALTLLISYSLPSTGMRWLLTLGSRSMDVYLVHIPFVATTRIVLDKVLGVHSLSIYMVIGMFFGIIGSLAFANLLRSTSLKYLLQPPEAMSLKARFLSHSRLQGQ